MKHILTALFFINIFAAVPSHAKTYKCEGAYQSSLITFSVASEGNLEIGNNLSLSLNDLSFSLVRMDDEKGQKWIHATVRPSGGDETIALYPADMPTIRLTVAKDTTTRSVFTCIAKTY